jgi:hypothetical protein
MLTAGIVAALPAHVVCLWAYDRRALARRGGDGTLPSGEAIARAHGPAGAVGRLVKNAGQAGAFGAGHGLGEVSGEVPVR